MNKPSPEVRIALIDDHTLFREGLRHALEGDGSLRVVAEAATLPDGIRLCQEGPAFDLALIDYQLQPTGAAESGLDVLRQLRRSRPEAKAIMLTGDLPAQALTEVVMQHRAGVFLKNEPLSELVLAIHKTVRGELWISSKATHALIGVPEAEPSEATAPAFSERELLVLRLITEGLGNKEIAFKLDTTESNVKAILQRLFEKTGVRSRSQLVRYVFEFNVELS